MKGEIYGEARCDDDNSETTAFSSHSLFLQYYVMGFNSLMLIILLSDMFSPVNREPWIDHINSAVKCISVLEMKIFPLSKV